MFTGIVDEIGQVRSCGETLSGYDLTVSAERVIRDAAIGDSIAVNGVCLTITALGPSSFTAGLAPETRQRTNLETLRSGDRVNLEPALLPTTRLGGHVVQGHVDTTGHIREHQPDRDALWITVGVDEPSLMRYIVPKGYIAIDGTSLTVCETGLDWFNVTLVAHTREHVVLPERTIGERVNLEVDVLGKYIERLLEHSRLGGASPFAGASANSPERNRQI